MHSFILVETKNNEEKKQHKTREKICTHTFMKRNESLLKGN